MAHISRCFLLGVDGSGRSAQRLIYASRKEVAGMAADKSRQVLAWDGLPSFLQAILTQLLLPTRLSPLGQRPLLHPRSAFPLLANLTGRGLQSQSGDLRFPIKEIKNMYIRRPFSSTLLSAVVCVLSAVLITGCGGAGVSSLAGASNGTGSAPSSPTASEGSLLASVRTVAGIGALAVDSSTHTAYVLAPRATQPSLIVVDDSTNSVKTTVNLSGDPDALAVDPTTNMVYIANLNANTVSVLNGETNAIVATIPVGNYPTLVAVDPTTDTIYVANSTDGTISVISGSTNKVTATVFVGIRPSAMVVNSAAGEVYVGIPADTTNPCDNTNPCTISVVSQKTNQVVNDWKTATTPYSMVLDSDNGTLYVANYEYGKNSTVSAIDVTSGQTSGSLTVGGPIAPEGIIVDPAAETLYAYLDGEGSILAIDTKTLQVLHADGFTALNSSSWGLDVDSSTHKLYVAGNEVPISASQSAYGSVNVYQGVSN